mgnify:CR=1 FL=1
MRAVATCDPTAYTRRSSSYPESAASKFCFNATSPHTANLRPVSEHPKLVSASPLRPELLVGAGHPAYELSMGMSSDYEIAVEEGATMIRLGTVLFGARPR